MASNEDFWAYGGGWGRNQSGDHYQSSSPTPRPTRGNADQRLVDQIRHGLNRLDVDAGTVAAGLSLLPNGIQRNLMDIILIYLGALADRKGRYQGHPMELTFEQARRMLDSIGEI